MSSTGWGAHVAHLSAAGVWSPTQAVWHNNLLEGVFLALHEFAGFLSVKTVLLCMDNTMVACYLNKQGGLDRIPSLVGQKQS